MKENESITKHIHDFRSHLDLLLKVGCLVRDNEGIITLMQSLPPSYKEFASFLRSQASIILESLIHI